MSGMSSGQGSSEQAVSYLTILHWVLKNQVKLMRNPNTGEWRWFHNDGPDCYAPDDSQVVKMILEIKAKVQGEQGKQ